MKFRQYDSKGFGSHKQKELSMKTETEQKYVLSLTIYIAPVVKSKICKEHFNGNKVVTRSRKSKDRQQKRGKQYVKKKLHRKLTIVQHEPHQKWDELK